MNKALRLRELIGAPEILVTPGVYDAFTAYRAQEAGFGAAFVSGSSLAMMQLARPDVGLLSLSETADMVARMAERVDMPLLVDADQGFGNSLMVARAVRSLERAGASGIQIEDQVEVKPAASPLSRPLISVEAMTDKIQAARDARQNDATVISARTDAMTSEGIDEALRRAHSYAAAGADMVFVESLAKRSDMERLVSAIGGSIPLLHNLLRPADEVTDATTLQDMGYSVALFPGVAVGAAGEALEAAFRALKTTPATGPSMPDRIGAAQFLKRD